MNPIDKLSRIDLNLLVALYVLLDERNVTRAASRLFITQPAASRTLTRLRELFDDPLLARSGSEMVMTPRAELLQAHLPDALAALGDLVAPAIFDPANHQQLFRVAIPEPFGQALAAPLLVEVIAEAPGVRLSFQSLSSTMISSLADGHTDFAFDKEDSNAADPGIEVTSVLPTEGVLIARRGHPLASKRAPSLKHLLQCRWVDCYPQDGRNVVAPLDGALADMGLERTVSFHSTHLLSALQAVRGTDCLLFLAAHTLDTPLLMEQFVQLVLPKELRGPQLQVVMLQHRRTLNSLPHQWLREKLLRLGKDHWTRH